MKGYPKWFTVTLISAVMLALFFSGLILAPTTLELRLDWEVPWRLATDLRIGWAAFHAFTAYAVVLILGALLSLHVRLEWKKNQNRKSGLSLILQLAILTLTGIGIYYFGNEDLSRIASLIHLIIGILFILVYFLHILQYRKKT